jgi:hypothetical protein
MLRITPISVSPQRATYALAGGVTADQLPRLRRLVLAALQSGKELTFDLSGVWLVERSTARLIVRHTSGLAPPVRLEGARDGLLEWLRDVSGEDI